MSRVELITLMAAVNDLLRGKMGAREMSRVELIALMSAVVSSGQPVSATTAVLRARELLRETNTHQLGYGVSPKRPEAPMSISDEIANLQAQLDVLKDQVDTLEGHLTHLLKQVEEINGSPEKDDE